MMTKIPFLIWNFGAKNYVLFKRLANHREKNNYPPPTTKNQNETCLFQFLRQSPFWDSPVYMATKCFDWRHAENCTFLGRINLQLLKIENRHDLSTEYSFVVERFHYFYYPTLKSQIAYAGAFNRGRRYLSGTCKQHIHTNHSKSFAISLKINYLTVLD